MRGGRGLSATPESLLAVGAASVGLLGVLSSLTAELANRSDLVQPDGDGGRFTLRLPLAP